MTAYNCDSKTILIYPFETKKDRDHIVASNSIMQCLIDCGHRVDLQILNNEVSVEYKCVIGVE